MPRDGPRDTVLRGKDDEEEEEKEEGGSKMKQQAIAREVETLR